MPERWNGTKWSLAPLSDKTSASGLADVSCPTPTTCLAVGSAAPLLDSGNRVLAERWNGAAWSVVPSATPTGKNVHADLSAIACVSATDCFAVGGYTKVPAGGSTDSVGGALIERWNGAKWSIVASPSPAPKLRRAVLRAVSCSSATDCNAVGDYTSISNQGGDVQHLLAMHWNGSVWSIVTIPGPATMLLSGISCPSATNCFAVGYTEEGLPVVNRWDGGQWTSASSPAPPANTAFGLDDVTCVSDTDCTIVGIRFSTSNFSGYKTLIERWNGTTWTIVSAPTPAGRTYPRLEAVACASASSCVGVGTFEEHPTTKISAPFILAWDGAAWSIATAAAVPGATTAVLSGVAPLGTGFAAVGASGGAFGSRTLVEQQS